MMRTKTKRTVEIKVAENTISLEEALGNYLGWEVYRHS